MAIQNKEGMGELITGFNRLSINEKHPSKNGSLWPFAINVLYFGSPYLDQVQKVALDHLFGGSGALKFVVSNVDLAEVLPSGDTIMLALNVILAGRYCWKQFCGTPQSQELVQTINRGKLLLKPLFGDDKKLAIAFVNLYREQLEVVNFDGYVLKDGQVKSLFVERKESDFQQLNTLCITESPEFDGTYLKLKELPNLQYLDLQGCTVCEIDLGDVTRFKYLNIKGCEKFELKLSSIGLKEAQSATTFCIDQHLTCVDLKGVEGLTCDLLNQLIQNSPNIKKIRLAKHPELDGEIDLKLWQNLQKMEAKQCNKLTFAWNVAVKQRIELDVDETVSFVPTFDAVCEEESLLQACNKDEIPPKLSATYNQLEDAIHFVTSNKCNRVNLEGFKITDETLQTLADGNSNITYLGISDSQLETGAALKEFENLETLIMTDCQFSDPDLGNLSRIGKIDLSGSEIQQSLNSLGCMKLENAVEFAINSKLPYLDFNGFKELTINYLQKIIKNSPNISTLILNKHSALEGEIDLKQLQKLKTLTVNKCKMLTFAWNVEVWKRIKLDMDSTNCFSPDLEKMGELEDLIETLNGDFTAILHDSISQFDEVKRFIKINPNLTHVNLEGFKITDKDLQKIADGNPNITHLFVTNSPELVTGEALHSLENLQFLVIGKCEQFIGDQLDISRFKNLKSFVLEYCPLAKPCLGDITQLEKVHLQGSSSLRPSLASLGFNDMEAAVKFAKASVLAYLDFTGIEGGSDWLFNELFAHSDQITHLIMSEQNEIEDLKELSNLRALEQLYIKNCSKFNMELNLNNMALTQLDISGCSGFSSAITCQPHTYKKLQLLNLSGTHATIITIEE